ncbi:Mitochondrial metalloendopeptidase OMA1 [Linum grandiflorum]
MVDEVMENMKILDPTHPDSVRVTAIFNRIIEALYRRLREDDDDDDTTKRPHYLYGWKWEIVVVDYPGVAASFVLGGKMCVSTGLLKHMQSDAEIATLIAREVAHAVARHILEFFSKKSWILFPYGIIRLISRDRAFSILYNHFDTKCPFSHKMYVEADHIGLLLMASAGYDPRVAPKVSEKLEKLSREIREMPYLDTYASGGERPQFQLLARAPVMEEALYWYRESEKPGPDVGTESCIE